MTRQKKAAPLIVGSLAAAPIVLYSISLTWDFAVKVWKVGWDGTPLTFIGVTGIIAFVGYGMSVASAAGLYAYWKADRSSGGLALLVAALVVLYAVAFTASLFGVLTPL